ncbi:MAG: HAMP domain-containing protein [Aquificae bacterium]|nr:HAMP domain-containing protein [Aquificota bacterium]
MKKIGKHIPLSKKKRNIIIWGVVSLIFLLGNIYIFKEISKVKDVFNPYLFLIIININVVFLLTIVAISLKNLIKLFFEESDITGKLRRKLFILILFLIIVPAMVLSISSITLISNATNLWFSGKVEKALKLTQEIIDQITLDYSHLLDEIVSLMEQEKVAPYEAIKKFNIQGIVILDKNKKPLMVYGKPKGSIQTGDFQTGKQLIVENGEYYLRYIRPFKGDRYILIDYKLPPTLSKYHREINTIRDIYSKIRYYKNPIRVSYILTMVIITVFVIFGGIWLGQYVVRNLTYPLEELVRASQRLARKDLNVKINIKAPDEIGILINEFNHMVDELKRLYTQLQESKEYLEAILENARTGVIYSDREGKIEKINKAAANILGIDPEKLKGKDIEKFMEEIGLDITHIDREQTIHFDGKIIIAKITKIPPKGYILVFDDITEIVAAEKILVWKEIAQRIAHEIKNPLTPIKLSAERIKRQYENQNPKFPQILDKSVDVIFKEVDHLSKLVKEFGQFASTDRKLNLKDVNLKGLFEELKNSYQTEDFKINIEIPEDLTVKADPKLIRQAFQNIIQNSYESVKKGKGQLDIKGKRENSKVILTFKDNGEGISPTDLEKVFIPYYSKKAKGSGLGLAITKEIIEKHGGSIKALPSEEGALFKVELKAG